ncbi:cortex morphogenetic protein CmpA [Chengkuizengella axinellae]|uniref:Cortex morphogenetic protein CmpA n=1 Tax=Chengkuizengella axinellae TaxID=3064388 RepID=A0ABT9J420_9BACL|nr:cortex morphogenetic protein CmpA [Chengkuizengella sp. 2205SS18-9]MDP5276318.1 cortex morphogenetic protein CmpA [Chengkuizengella sp. 2205SS18-9]
MPNWFYNQLIRAYRNKDKRKVQLLNECWFFYNQLEKKTE